MQPFRSIKDCSDARRFGRGKSGLTDFTSVAPRSAKPAKRKLCALEVGTADGSGTTVAFHYALSQQCSGLPGYDFRLYTVEAVESLANSAKVFWAGSTHVHVIHGIVMREQEILDKFAIRNINAPENSSNKFPSKSFYRYNNMHKKKQTIFGSDQFLADAYGPDFAAYCHLIR